MPKNANNSIVQKFIAIGGRANCAITYIEKGYYQKAKEYLRIIVEISEKEIEKFKEKSE